MRSGVVALIALACLSSTTIAQADGVVVSQELFDGDGWPLLLAYHHPDSSRAVPSWSVCAPDCGPTVATHNAYAAGPTQAGTAFEVSATVDGTTTTDRSRVWTGRVTNVSPPTLAGYPVVGQTLTPSAGTWTGGWGDEVSLVGVRACSTAAAEGCRALTASTWQPGHPTQVTIDSAYRGWYVGAIETRAAAQLAYPASLPVFPPGRVSPHPAPRPGQTVAVSPLIGPITDPTPRPSATPPRLPRVTLRKRAFRQGKSLVLGTLTCSRTCVAQITMSHGHRTKARRIVVRNQRATITLWPGTFPRRARAVRVTARFDGFSKVTRGTVALR